MTQILGTKNLEGLDDQASEKKEFRGVAVHISKDGQLRVEVVDVPPIEIYGALTLVMERLRKQVGLSG